MTVTGTILFRNNRVNVNDLSKPALGEISTIPGRHWEPVKTLRN